MQLRISPGAGTPCSSRSLPLEPPSSVTVTIAVNRDTSGATGGGPGDESANTCFFRPRSRVERPVPPPMATTWTPRAGFGLDCVVLIGWVRCKKLVERGAASELNSYGAFRVEQLSKARIVGHIAEIRVVARLEAVAGVKTDGLGQMLQALRGAAGEALEHGAAVPDVVQRRALVREVLQMLARGDEVSQVHERNGKIVVLLGGGEGILVLVQLLIADIHVDLGAVA